MKREKMLRSIKFGLFILLGYIPLAYSQIGVKIIGTRPAMLVNTAKQSAFAIKEPKKYKSIRLLKLKFSPEFIKAFQKKAKRLTSQPTNNHRYPGHPFPYKQLGMNGVPVFDQGTYGTCTTFAVTSVLNAEFYAHKGANGDGNYLSQQCLLAYDQLWNGAIIPEVLNTIEHIGGISRSLCPYQYPATSEHLDDSHYRQLSQQDMAGAQLRHHTWSHFSPISTDGNDAMIQAMLNAIDAGHRLVISTLILPGLSGTIGAPINGYSSGLWQLPDGKQSAEALCGHKLEQCSGHTLIVIGYDLIHHLFLLRNSWGSGVGVKGDYYMSFAYAKLMINEIYQVTGGKL